VSRLNCSAAAALAACALLVPAWGSPVRAAFDARDVFKLEASSRGAASANERNLAQGAVLELRHKDDAAIVALKRMLRPHVPGELRSPACGALADIYLRQSRFADMKAALECVKSASHKPLAGEMLQNYETAALLAHEKPMQLAHPAAGKLDVTRDLAGLIRVPVEINGKAQDAVVDTGAGFSTISESAAARLGVRVLEKGTTIKSSSIADLPIHLGLADKLTIGDAEFSNVVFVVLPDVALTFAGGKFKIDAVIGLPVMLPLGRIEVADEGGKDYLYYGHRTGEAAATESNLILGGVEPFVLVYAEKARGVMRLFVDSGGTESVLNTTAVKDFPALAEGAAAGEWRWEGAGGAAKDTKALTLSELRFTIAGRTCVLRKVSVLSDPEADQDGMIGLDVLRQGKRWILDFDSMSLVVAD